MRIPLPLTAPLALSLVLAALPARAQSGDTVVLQPENVRMDLAQVMRVQPIYQTLRATRMEHRCADATAGREDGDRRLSRIVGAVRGALSRKPEAAAQPGADCEMVPVEREFRRPIAYDVDYVYRGMKYRSRLPYDPGTRLRVRVSVVPYIPARNER